MSVADFFSKINTNPTLTLISIFVPTSIKKLFCIFYIATCIYQVLQLYLLLLIYILFTHDRHFSILFLSDLKKKTPKQTNKMADPYASAPAPATGAPPAAPAAGLAAPPLHGPGAAGLQTGAIYHRQMYTQGRGLVRVFGLMGAPDSVYALYNAPGQHVDLPPFTFPVSKYSAAWPISESGLRTYLLSKDLPSSWLERMNYDELFACAFHGHQLDTYLYWGAEGHDVWFLFWHGRGPRATSANLPNPRATYAEINAYPTFVDSDARHPPSSREFLEHFLTLRDFTYSPHFVHGKAFEESNGFQWACYHLWGLERQLHHQHLLDTRAGATPPRPYVWFREEPTFIVGSDGESREWRDEAQRLKDIGTERHSLLCELYDRVGYRETSEEAEMVSLFRQARRGERPLVLTHPRVTDALQGMYPPTGGPVPPTVTSQPYRRSRITPRVAGPEPYPIGMFQTKIRDEAAMLLAEHRANMALGSARANPPASDDDEDDGEEYYMGPLPSLTDTGDVPDADMHFAAYDGNPLNLLYRSEAQFDDQYQPSNPPFSHGYRLGNEYLSDTGGEFIHRSHSDTDTFRSPEEDNPTPYPLLAELATQARIRFDGPYYAPYERLTDQAHHRLSAEGAATWNRFVEDRFPSLFPTLDRGGPSSGPFQSISDRLDRERLLARADREYVAWLDSKKKRQRKS